MKKIDLLLLLALQLFVFRSSAQAPDWLWADGAGGSGLETAGGIAVDNNGNSYITGEFSAPSITFGTTTLTGALDLYVVKYDAAGNVVWATSAGGSLADEGYDIAVDDDGNCYVTGGFASSSITFGTTTLTNATPGSPKIFVAKYNASGSPVWAISGTGNYPGQGRGIAVDGSGNSYTTGSFSYQPVTFGSTTLNTAGQADVFTLALDAAGNVLWAKSAGGIGDESVTRIAIDGSGNSYITGSFGSSSMAFGSITLTGTGGDFFVAQYDENGTPQWAKSTSGGGGWDIAVDGGGNSYVVGPFNSSITFGSTTLTGAGNTDGFIARFDPAGNVVWATGIGGSDYEGVNSIGLDGAGNIHVNGYFQSSSITLGTTTLTNFGSSDVFFAQYSSSGSPIWATSTGGSGSDLVRGLAVDGDGNIYNLGVFYSPSITFGSTTLTNAGSTDVFVAVLAGATGMNEINGTGNALSVFPNPASDQLTVQCSTSVQRFEVHDVLGREHDPAFQVLGSDLKVDVSSLDRGTYFMMVRAGDLDRVARFVKQ